VARALLLSSAMSHRSPGVPVREPPRERKPPARDPSRRKGPVREPPSDRRRGSGPDRPIGDPPRKGPVPGERPPKIRDPKGPADRGPVRAGAKLATSSS